MLGIDLDKPPFDDECWRYVWDVLAGAFVTSGKIRQLCHILARRAEGYKRWHYDPERAQRAVTFIERFCCLTTGQAGRHLKLEPFQKFVVMTLFGWVDDKGLRQFQEALILIARKNGKALSLDTPIPTPSGYRRMGDVHPGDYVYGVDGNPKRVLVESEIFDKPMYRVTFEDGEVIKASADHTWSVRTRSVGKLIRYKPTSDRKRPANSKVNPNGTIDLTTEQMAEGWFYERADGKGREYKYRVPMNSPIEHESKDLPIDPYLLGAWLGDGSSKDNRIHVGREDVDAAMELLSDFNPSIKTYGDRAVEIRVGESFYDEHGVKHNTVRDALRELGVWNNKHIPSVYLEASIEQRMELLRGLMDTDGSVGKAGECSFSQKNRRMLADMTELLSGLGIKSKHRDKTIHCGRSVCQAYEILFFTDKTMPCFKLPRKYERLKEHLASRMSWKSIVNIEQIPNEPSKCIMVDSDDHLYLCGHRYTATHNSELSAAISLYMLVADGEYGVQGYFAGVTEPQAALCYGAAQKMMRQSPALMKRLRMGQAPQRRRQGILYDTTDSYLTTLSMDMPLDGLNVHFCVCDELAAWKSRGPYDDIKQGMSAREQPMMLSITTANFVRNSIYDEQYAYTERWLNGEIEDDRYIAFVWELDRDDDWMGDEACWPKANPGLGTIKKLDALRSNVQKAKNDPAFRPTVLTKDFNIPQNSSSAWLTWEESGSPEVVDFDSMGFRYAVVGFDYAQSVDLTAAQVLCMRPGDEHIYETSMYWIPQAKLDEQEKVGGHATKDHAPYRTWIDKGYMRVVEGNVVPPSVLAQFIEELRDERGIYTFALGYDSWHIIGSDRELLEQMIGKDRCEQVVQGAKTLSDPMNRIRADYRQGRFIDNANPVNRWCRMNVMVTTDTNLNILPDKKEAKGSNKIDGFMAELDAYIALLRHEDEYRAFIS